MKLLKINKFNWLFSIVVGILFIVSGFLKAIKTGDFVLLIDDYGFTAVSSLSPVIIITEISFGLAILFNTYRKEAALAALIMILSFTFILIYAIITNKVNDCGCFGSFIQLPTWLTFLKNIVLIICLYGIFRWSEPVKYNITLIKIIVFIIIIATAGFMTGYTYFDTSKSGNNIDYTHQNIKQTSFMKYLPDKTPKTMMIFCFSYACPYCLNSIAQVELYKNKVDTIIALALYDSLAKQQFIQHFSPTYKIKDISTDEMMLLTYRFPLTLFVKNDTVIYQKQGFLQAPILLQDKLKNLLK